MTDTPETDALIARHRAETQQLYFEHPNLPSVIFREHATRQTTELIEHVKGMERALKVWAARRYERTT
jgi:hypothetical protein